MTLQEDMDSKRSWTQDEINGLKQKYKRTHFTHFKGAPVKLKRARRKKINGVPYIRMFGRWIKAKQGASAPEASYG